MLPFTLENAVHIFSLTHSSFPLKQASALQARRAPKSPPCSTLTAFTPTAVWHEVDPHVRVHHVASNPASCMLCFWSREATWNLLFYKVDLMQRDTACSLSCSTRKQVKHKILLFRNMPEQLIIYVFYLKKNPEAKQKSLQWNCRYPSRSFTQLIQFILK